MGGRCSSGAGGRPGGVDGCGAFAPGGEHLGLGLGAVDDRAFPGAPVPEAAARAVHRGGPGVQALAPGAPPAAAFDGKTVVQ